jgi:hypothetical protein
LLADEVDVDAGGDALVALPELVEGVEAVIEVPAVSEEPFDVPSPELLVPPEAAPIGPAEEPPTALSAAVTAGAASLVLALPLSPPPLLRKSVTYQPEPLS